MYPLYETVDVLLNSWVDCGKCRIDKWIDGWIDRLAREGGKMKPRKCLGLDSALALGRDWVSG